MNPAISFRNALIEHLRANVGDIDDDLPEASIRTILDVDGEPVGSAGVLVSASDLGSHDGLPGRILVDIEVTLQAFTHLDEDASGCRLDVILSNLMQMVGESPFPAVVDGWAVRHVEPWSTEHRGIFNESFRSSTLKSTLYLQNLNP